MRLEDVKTQIDKYFAETTPEQLSQDLENYGMHVSPIIESEGPTEKEMLSAQIA